MAHRFSDSARVNIIAGDDSQGRRSIVMLNKEQDLAIQTQIYDEAAGGTLAITLPPKSITSFMWQE